MTREHGFTLLEVLVALVILAVAATGLIGATTQSIRQAQWLEIKTMAAWVAENRLAELRATRGWPDAGSASDRVSMGGREWDVRVTIAQSQRPDMQRIVVAVAPAGDAAIAVSLTGFLGRY